MDFRISEDSASLVCGVRDYLTDMHAPEALRGLDASGGRSAAIAQGLIELGLPGLLVPEEQGGLGLGVVDGVLIAVELGRAGVAEPLADSALVAVSVLAAAGGHEALLAAIATGAARVALQHPVNPWVADLDAATHLLSSDGDGLFLSTVTTKPQPLDSVDPLRNLYAPAAPAERTAVGGADTLLNHATLMAAAQLVGLADAMLAMSIEYAKSRNQFGQAIGGFQAIKHHLASATVAIEFAKPVLYRAAVALAEGVPSAAAHVSHAKLAAGDAAWGMAETAIQVHGAMGYTYEVDLHFWMKRSWALAGSWGGRAFHLARLDPAVIGGGLAIGPASTFA